MRSRSAWHDRTAASAAMGACALAATITLVPAPARADCFLSGANVTCAPPGSGGFVAASDGLTLTVQQGATVNDNGTQAISVNNNSTVNNNGTVNAAGANSTGITLSGNGNTATNSATGVISVTGDYATGINSNGANQITNNGTIYVRGLSDSSTHSVGIASGPSVGGLNDTITNNGTIWVTAADAAGIFGINGQPTIYNYGTVSVTAAGVGIWAGSGAVLTNAGTVSASGAGAFGVEFDSNGTGTFTNSGTVSATGANAEAVHIRGLGAFSSITLTNDGTLGATGLGSYALRSQSAFGGAPSGATIINNGTIDGRIDLGAGSDVLTNKGLITVTSGSIPLGTVFSITDGSFTQTSTGTLALRVDNSGGQDILAISNGSATLAGTLKAVIQPGLYASTTAYSGVITTCGLCGGVSGTFGSTISSSPFFSVAANYGALTVDLTVTRIAFNAVAGLTPNQSAIANALEPHYSTSLTGSAATFYGNLLAATSVTVFDQLSGSGTAAAQNASFGAAGLFGDAMQQQGLAWVFGAPGGGSGFGAPLQYAAADKAVNKPGYDAFAAMRPRGQETAPWRAWALGFGSTRSIDGSGGTADQSMQTAGGAVGVERTLGPDLLVGLAAGGSGSHFSASSLSTSGNIDGGHLGGYVARRWGDVYALATVNYAHFDNTTDRTIAGVGATESAHGRFGSDQLGGRFEVGWRRRIAGYAVTPFVAVEPAALWQQAYAEASTAAGGGAGILALSYSARETTSLPTFVGAQLDGQYRVGGHMVRPFVRAAWVHEFMTERQVSASFVSIPAASFTVDGARPANDAARISGGLTWTIDTSKTVFARVDSEFSGGGTMVAGTAGARLSW